MEEKNSTYNDTTKLLSNILSTLPDMKLHHVIITVFLFFTSTRILSANTTHIFALILIYLVLTRVQAKEAETGMDVNQDMDYKLEMLGAPLYFHVDVNFINLFFDIFGWREKNPNNFDHAIKSVNNVLKLETDTEKPLKRCMDSYEVAFDQGKIALNMMHGFVYVLDHPLKIEKLKKVLTRLQQLLERHLAKMRENCDVLENAKESLDIDSKFVQDSHGPKPYDSHKMSPFDFY